MYRTFSFSSNLPVSAEQFWSSQTLATVNEELGPLYRMTAPAEALHKPITEWPKYTNTLQSWVLLLGLIPVDRHSFGRIRFTGPTAFVEESSSWLNRQWKHERVVSGASAGCEVKDTIAFEPRLPLLGSWQRFLYILAFRHRHAVLKKRCGLFTSA